MKTLQLEHKNATARARQEEAYQALLHAHERIQDSRERDPDLCQGFRDYGGVRGDLEAALSLLERKTYRVALAGMMSAGKSTLANALLRRPGLLPTGIEETTLTITVVTSPDDGREGLTVHYLSYDDALRGIFQRGHYVKHLPEELVAQARAGAPGEALRTAIEERVRDGHMPDDVRQQLLGFLDALEDKKGLLGSTIHPSLEERRYYLAPRTHRDVGHLLLIEKAEICVENELFTRDGIEFVDLPGADSTNERQRRIAHEYLRETDLLVAVPNAAGFRFVDIDMLERFREARGAIRSRVFFVLNRFDEAKIAELSSKETSLAYLKKIVDMLARDYDAGNLFFTVGLWAQLEERGGESSPEDRREMERVRQATMELVDHFERQGVIDAVQRDWNEQFASRVAESLLALREHGGVDRLRSELVRYLKNELELARLREIQARLLGASRTMSALVEPERPRVSGFLDSAREQIRATGAFVNQLSYLTRASLEQAHSELGAREGETDEYQFQLLVRRLSEHFAQAIQAVLGQDNDLIDFRYLARDGHLAGPEQTMRRIIDHARGVLSRKFIDLLIAKLAGEVGRRYREALEPLENERTLEQFGKVIEKPELRWRYDDLLQELNRGLVLVTRTRAHEETWGVAAMEFSPAPGNQSFAELEPRFRQALIEELQTIYANSFQALGGVLLRHYRIVLDGFLAGFEEITSDALQEARQQGATVPMELLVEKASADDQRRYALADLIHAADAAQDAVEQAAAELLG